MTYIKFLIILCAFYVCIGKSEDINYSNNNHNKNVHPDTVFIQNNKYSKKTFDEHDFYDKESGFYIRKLPEWTFAEAQGTKEIPDYKSQEFISAQRLKQAANSVYISLLTITKRASGNYRITPAIKVMMLDESIASKKIPPIELLQLIVKSMNQRNHDYQVLKEPRSSVFQGQQVATTKYRYSAKFSNESGGIYSLQTLRHDRLVRTKNNYFRIITSSMDSDSYNLKEEFDKILNTIIFFE